MSMTQNEAKAVIESDEYRRKNSRRHDLIHRKVHCKDLNEAEEVELDELQRWTAEVVWAAFPAPFHSEGRR